MSLTKYLAAKLTPLEQERLLQFRAKCSINQLTLNAELQQDDHLVKWLRARNLDVTKAYDMLKTSLAWRNRHQVDTILEQKVPQEFRKQAPLAFCGVDGNGLPIFILPLGHQNVVAMLELYGFEALFRYNLAMVEEVIKIFRTLSKEQGRTVTKFVAIIDLEGYNYRQFTSKLFRDFTIELQLAGAANYPEIVEYSCIVNAPRIFPTFFNMLKPFIPKQTLEKVEIFGTDGKWKKVVGQKFPADQVPPRWGGTKGGTDEFCSTDSIWLYGPLNLNFYNTKGLSVAEKDPKIVSTKINARDCLKVELDVTKTSDSIHWKIYSKDYDIGFKIERRYNEVVVPFTKLQPGKWETGSIECHVTGKCTAILDNSYSFARAKSVQYHIEVV